MRKVVVVYDSRSGFTEKMAKAVVEGAKSVKDVEVELLKVGTPFSISKLSATDGIIFGSPTIYGSVTQEMRNILTSLREHKEAGRLSLSGKIGGVFGSYGWDGGWVVDKLALDMKDLGVTVVAPPVSAVHEQYATLSIDEETLQKCRDLGKAVAQKVAG